MKKLIVLKSYLDGEFLVMMPDIYIILMRRKKNVT
jgi:hypothetical protein